MDEYEKKLRSQLADISLLDGTFASCTSPSQNHHNAMYASQNGQITIEIKDSNQDAKLRSFVIRNPRYLHSVS